MATQARDAAIVGIHEYPLRDVEGRVSPLQIKAESAAAALADAGLNWAVWMRFTMPEKAAEWGGSPLPSTSA